MKICTWNINGIRALRPSFAHFLSTLDADIFCVQETKISRDNIDEATAVVPGFNSYFSFSRIKPGYSGVAVFSKDPICPVWAEDGLTGLLSSDNPPSPPLEIAPIFNRESPASIDALCENLDCSRPELQRLDSEGRCVQVCYQLSSLLMSSAQLPDHAASSPDYSSSHVVQPSLSPLEPPEPLSSANIVELEPTRPYFTLICVYCIRADPTDSVRQQAKIQFYKLLQWRVRRILDSGLSNVLIVGDMNVAHREIDTCEPEKWEDFARAEPRKWMDQFAVLDPVSHRPFAQSDLASASESTFSGEFVDVFRFHHPDERLAYTNWCTLTGARANNYGTRIDYVLADRSLICGASQPQQQQQQQPPPSDFEPTRSARSGRPVARRGWTPSRNCWLRRDVLGSDHCPLFVELALAFECPPRPPPLCTRFMPEFGGGRTQLKLSAFFADSSDRHRHKALPPAEKFGSQSSSSSACQYLDLTANDSAANCNCKSGATPTSTSTRATAQLTSASSRPVQRTQAAVKRKASEKAASAHTKITMFFDRLSQRPRNAAEETDAAPVAARASDRSFSSSSTTVSDIASHSEPTDTSPLIVSGDGEPSPNIATGPTSCPTLTYASSDPSAPSTASSASASGSSGSKEGAGTGAGADARSAWERLLSAPAVPLCRHGEPAVKRQVRKEGANRGRHFWCCERSAGRADDPAARCGFFQWCLK